MQKKDTNIFYIGATHPEKTEKWVCGIPFCQKENALVYTKLSGWWVKCCELGGVIEEKMKKLPCITGTAVPKFPKTFEERYRKYNSRILIQVLSTTYKVLSVGSDVHISPFCFCKNDDVIQPVGPLVSLFNTDHNKNSKILVPITHSTTAPCIFFPRRWTFRFERPYDHYSSTTVSLF